jgi:uncharacterized membrane protein
MEFGGVGRVVGWDVTGTLRAATAVKLSRPEVIAISRTADAIVAMLTVLGVVDLLRDVSALRRKRMLALLPVADTVRRDDRRWLLLLLMLAGAMAVVWGVAVGSEAVAEGRKKIVHTEAGLSHTH